MQVCVLTRDGTVMVYEVGLERRFNKIDTGEGNRKPEKVDPYQQLLQSYEYRA